MTQALKLDLVGGFIIWTFFTWLLLDAWLGPAGLPTESQVIAYWARHLTFWTFLLGALFGHWLLGRQSANYSSWFWPLVAIAVLVAWDVAFLNKNGWIQVWYRSPWIWLWPGMIAGSIFWPQQDPGSFIP